MTARICAGTCGRPLYTRGHTPGPGEVMCQAQGMCSACYNRRKKPRAIGPCRTCGTPMVPQRSGTPPRGHRIHAANQQCRTCYTNDLRKRQRAAKEAAKLANALNRIAPLPDLFRKAACAGTDPNLFFPHSEQDTVTAAKTICGSCPIQTECATYATQTGQQGIWGGTTTKQRRLAAIGRPA